MKKFLSLVLALVMTMSLVTISAGAKEFADDDKITYEEAVNVISTIGVVDGYADGSFNPQGSLTRGAAAKIICNMILGPTTAAELHADTAPYKDVPVNHTFAGYIAYCAKEGIISGYADGTFRPAGTLTGYAFMKMLLGALGYDAAIEGYTGANWSINVAKQALNIGLNKSLEGDFNGIKAVNREEAALYAFNTLKADMVEYDTTISTTINGQTVTIGNSKAKAMEWLNSASRKTNIKDDKYIQFAEQYFTKLVLTPDIDAFGRPTREWEFNGKDIGTYVNTDLLVETYTAKVTGKDLYELLGKSTVEDYGIAIYVDGETEKTILGDAYFTDGNIVKTNTEKVGETGNGVTTEVYVDVDAKEVTIAIINTYLAKATDDYNEKKEEASFKVFKIDDAGDKQYVKTKKSFENFKVSNDDINVEDIEDKDIVLVTVADGEIQTIARPEVLEDVSISKFTKGKSITTDGTDYKYASTAMYDEEVLDAYDDQNLKETSYNVFLDANGYLVGIEIVEEASKYLFLSGMDGNGSNLSVKNADANVIFLDGTMDTVKVNTAKSLQDDGVTPLVPGAVLNTWCTYSIDKNGVYTLTQVAENFNDDDDKVGQEHDTTSIKIDKKNVSLDGSGDFTKVYGNDSTVYITVDTKLIMANDGNGRAIIVNDIDTVSTGVQSTSLLPYTEANVEAKHSTALATNRVSYGVYTLFKDNGYVIGAVVVGEDEGTTTNYAYIVSDDVNVESFDIESEEYTWTRDAIVNGKEVELTEVGEKLAEIGPETSKGNMKMNEWYEVKYYADGTVRSATLMSFDGASGHYNAKWIDTIEEVVPTVNGYDGTVVLFENMTLTTYDLSCKGNTLFVDNSILKRGFAVAPNAQVVLAQDKAPKSDPTDISLMDDVTVYDEGVAGIEKAINDLNGNFTGYLSAVFEGGVATSVIIYDKTATIVNDGTQTSTGVYKIVDDDADNYYTAPTWYTSESPVSPAKVMNALAAAIRADGYKVVNMSIGASVAASSLTWEDEHETQYTVYGSNMTQLVKVTLNGKAGYYQSGNTFKNTGSTGKNLSGLYATNDDGATFVATSTGFTVASTDMEISDGYVTIINDAVYVSGTPNTTDYSISITDGGEVVGGTRYVQKGDTIEVTLTRITAQNTGATIVVALGDGTTTSKQTVAIVDGTAANTTYTVNLTVKDATANIGVTGVVQP